MDAHSMVAVLVVMVAAAFAAAEYSVRRARARDSARAGRIRRGVPVPWYEIVDPRTRADGTPVGYPWSSGPGR